MPSHPLKAQAKPGRPSGAAKEKANEAKARRQPETRVASDGGHIRGPRRNLESCRNHRTLIPLQRNRGRFASTTIAQRVVPETNRR
ncbi:hypothetical protein CHELA40_15300 [Chelatococcus asaccharovorans]|nr:hypothetical protein CHELA17_60319 [Chelatococcus asaccharovorans]CAH1682102.1 hypothetical protein CHELA40_15300 [Chelatococcus asaccharovorans]